MGEWLAYIRCKAVFQQVNLQGNHDRNVEIAFWQV